MVCLNWRVVICEDQKSTRMYLKQLTEKKLPFKVIGEAENAKDAFQLFHQWSPDLLLLDVHLSDQTGITLAREIRKIDPYCIIVFITGYSHYLHDAFDTYATDYIQKPVQESRFLETLSRINKHLSLAAPTKKLVLSFRKEKVFLDPAKIVLIESKERKTNVITTGDNYEIYMPLKRLEDLLPPYFQRINKRQIINMEKTTKIETCVKEKYYMAQIPEIARKLEITPTYAPLFLRKLSYGALGGYL